MGKEPRQATTLTVAIGWVEAIVAAATRGGAREADLLDKAGIGPLPTDPMARIPLDAVVRLWRAAVDLTGDNAFGLRMGASIEPTSFNVVAYTLLSSNSLREAGVHMRRFQRLISDGGRTQMLEQNGLAWLVYHPIEDHLSFSPQQVEAVLACAARLLRWIVGPGFKPSKVAIAHGAVSAPEVYREILDCAPEFNAGFNGIGMPPDLLDAPLPARNTELCRLHESLARRHLSSLESAASTKNRVVAVVEQMLSQGMAKNEQVAGMLGVSPRTLQHRLAEEDTSFLEVLDEVRHKLAIGYINDPMLSLGQIATLLNFSDASAFYRAFKRWTGKVPGDYRKAALGEAKERVEGP